MTNDNYTCLSGLQIVQEVDKLNIHPNYLVAYLKINNRNLLNEILQRTNFLDDYYEKINSHVPIVSRLYCLRNNISEHPICRNPNCQTHNKVKWCCRTQKFQQYCSTKCRANDPDSWTQKRLTMIKRHGVPHALQSKQIRQKCKETWIKTLGVDNPGKSLTVLSKMRQTYIEKYGEKQSISNEELQLDEFVKSICNDKIEFNVRNILPSTRELDIYIPSKHLAIEFNGDYWHCNPIKYNESYFHKELNMTAKQKWEYDELKINECQKMGIDLIVVWEYNWVHDKEQVKVFLQKRINGV